MLQRCDNNFFHLTGYYKFMLTFTETTDYGWSVLPKYYAITVLQHAMSYAQITLK